jgi:hypothetical protein
MRLRNHYLKQMKRLSENKKLINIMQRTIKMIGSIKYQVKKKNFTYQILYQKKDEPRRDLKKS